MTAAKPRGGAASVVSLYRYPVKAMLGERVSELVIDERGVAADRQWSVRTREGRIGSGKNTRRFSAVPGLQQLRAQITPLGVMVTLPDGSAHSAGSEVLQHQLGQLLGQPVTLAPESDDSHFDDGPVSLIARSSVAAVSEHRGEPIDEIRFRPNVVLDGVGPFSDEEWIGRRLHIGDAILWVEQASPRCTMVDDANADLPSQHGNLLAVGHLNRGRLGVISRVERPGVVRVGDGVAVT